MAGTCTPVPRFGLRRRSVTPGNRILVIPVGFVVVHNTSGSSVLQERSSGNRDEFQAPLRDARAFLRAICDSIERACRCKRAFGRPSGPQTSVWTKTLT